MNNGQRCQINFLEHITFLLLSVTFVGFYYQWVAVGLGSAMFLGRLLFSIGYVTNGPQGRMIGALIMDLAILVAFIMTVVVTVKLAQ